MVSIYPHGVYNTEQATSLTAPITGSAGLQVVFGTAPIHLAADPAAAANSPKLCYTFAECVSALGYSDDFEKFTLCQSMNACFRAFNVAPIILVNVLNPNNTKHITQNEEKAVEVAKNQALYDVPYVLLNTITVKADDAELAADTDYIAAHDDDGNVLITLLSETAQAATTITVSSTSINPDGVTAEDIVGGVDAATGAETGLELVRQIYPKFNLVPGLLLAPGWSQNPTVAAALQAKTESINGVFTCNCLIDIPTDGENGAKTYADVKTAKEKLGATGSHSIGFYPQVVVGDKQCYYSAVAGALLAYTDAGNSDVPYESPDNKSIPITATVLADGSEIYIDQEQGNAINSYGVVTAINNNGYRCWGNNTLAYPATTDPKDRWISVRRFFDWDGNNFIQTYFQKVGKPANKRLIQSIVDSQNIIGNGYVARDYCAGYRVEFRDDENPATNLLNGHITVHTYLAPYIPAEFIENIREYDTDALQSALGGE